MEKEITLKIKAVTEVLNHIQPRGPALWRAAPFRGAARWWFRALTGAFWEVDVVRKKEKELFGSTEQSSAVIFRVRALESDSGEFDVNPGSDRNIQVPGLKPGSTAELKLVASPYGQRVDCLNEVYASVWLAIHLGGIGQRARRGAGSLCIDHHEPQQLTPAPITTTDPAEYARLLSKGIASARNILRLQDPRKINGLPEFPVLHPMYSLVRVVQTDWEKDIRNKLMSARRNPKFHQGQNEPHFGSVNPRLSSPLHVRVASFNNKGAILICSLLKHKGAKGLDGLDWSKAEAFVEFIGSAVKL